MTNKKLTYQELERELARLNKEIETLKTKENFDKISEAQYQAVIANMGDVIGILRADGIFSYISPNVEKYFGWKPEDLVGKNGFINIHPDELKRTQELFHEFLQKEDEADSKECRFRCKNGVYKWIELTAVNNVNKPLINGVLIKYHDISDRKRGEQSLRDSEANLKAIIENSLESIWSLDTNYRIKYVNDVFPKSFEQSFGVHLSAGVNILEALPEPLRPLWKERYDRAFNNEHFVLTDKIDLVNSPVYIEVAMNPILVEDKVIGASFYGRNTSESKKHEIELIAAKEKAEESEAKYRKLSNLTFEGIIIHENGIVIDMNLSSQNMLGYSLKELAGKNIIELLIPEDYHSLVYKKVKKKSTAPYEIEIKRKDGSSFPAEVQGKAIGVKNGNKNIRVAAIRDISQHKKAEKEIIKLTMAVNQSANTIVITDTNGNIEYVNPKFTELTGYTAKEALGQNPRILNAETQPKEYYAEMWQTITKEKIWRGEFHNKKKDGDYFWESVTITPIKDQFGDITNFLAIKEDVTSLKENEKKLQLQNKELSAAKEKAEESDRLKSAFLANMSHEIRTPMNGILGFSDLLKDPELTGDEKLEYIDIIEQSGDRLLNTINDIIDISKIEAGQMDVSISDVCINEQMDFFFSFFKPEADQKRIEFVYTKELSDKESLIKTDQKKINSILTNLIKNSIKYTPKGKIEFGYKLISSTVNKHENEKVQELEFYIKDTGIGIRANQQEAIFRQFIQADTVDKMAYEGSGLGLSISKAYAEMLGGKIWVESIEEEGSQFYFKIPYNPITNEVNKRIEAHPLVDLNSTKKINILIVEDNELASKHLCYILKGMANKLLLAKNGKEAVEFCQNKPDIDLVLMDIQMPELNGYEATKQIRTFDTEIIIIAQTSYALLGDREKALQAGCNDYIPKPTEKQKLFELIDKHVKGWNLKAASKEH